MNTVPGKALPDIDQDAKAQFALTCSFFKNTDPLKYFSATQIHDGRQWLPEGSIIAFTDEGTFDSIHEKGNLPATAVRHYEGILCPGFVNVHCHLELSHMKGQIPEGEGLVAFLKNVMLQRNNYDEETREAALQQAITASKKNGIVAVGDITNGTDTLKYRPDAGLHIHSFIESIGFTETKAAERFAYSEQVYRRFDDQARLAEHPHVLRQSIVPHAPYSVSHTMFGLIDSFDKDALISIHNEETAAENELYEQKTGQMFELYEALGIDAGFFEPSGKSSLQTYLPRLAASHPVILVHNTFLDERDIHFILEAKRQVFLCLCPNANWYIERQLPDIALFEKSGLPVCLGTDSLASNHQLSIWSEVQLIRQHFPEITLETLLCWATYNGAQALQLERYIGSMETGKQPGLVHIDPSNEIYVIL